MPQPPDPSTHDDLIEIDINLASLSQGRATLTNVLVLQDDVTPGGGRVATFTSLEAVQADVLAGNLDATSEEIARVFFAQGKPSTGEGHPEQILFGEVDLAGSSETAAEALDAVIAEGAQFTFVLYESRDVTRQAALAVDIEAKATAASNPIYLILGLQDDDVDWFTPGIPAAWTSVEDFEYTVMYFHDDNAADAVSDRLDAAQFGFSGAGFSPDDFANGWNAPVVEVDLLGTPKHTQAQKQFLRDNNANTARPFGTRTDLQVDPGKTLAGRPVDHIVSTIWMRTRVAEAVADAIVETAERGSKITVDPDGQEVLAAAIEGITELGIEIDHFLAATPLIRLEITAADITAQRLRFEQAIQWSTGVRRVGVNLFFDAQAVV